MPVALLVDAPRAKRYVRRYEWISSRVESSNAKIHVHKWIPERGKIDKRNDIFLPTECMVFSFTVFLLFFLPSFFSLSLHFLFVFCIMHQLTRRYILSSRAFAKQKGTDARIDHGPEPGKKFALIPVPSIILVGNFILYFHCFLSFPACSLSLSHFFALCIIRFSPPKRDGNKNYTKFSCTTYGVHREISPFFLKNK